MDETLELIFSAVDNCSDTIGTIQGNVQGLLDLVGSANLGALGDGSGLDGLAASVQQATGDLSAYADSAQQAGSATADFSSGSSDAATALGDIDAGAQAAAGSITLAGDSATQTAGSLGDLTSTDVSSYFGDVDSSVQQTAGSLGDLDSAAQQVAGSLSAVTLGGDLGGQFADAAGEAQTFTAAVDQADQAVQSLGSGDSGLANIAPDAEAAGAALRDEASDAEHSGQAHEAAAEGAGHLGEATRLLGDLAGGAGLHLGELGEGADKLKESLAAVTSEGALSAEALTAVGAGVAAIGVAGVVEAAHSFVELGDDVHELAESAGVSTDTVQGLQYALKTLGFSGDEANRSLMILQRNAGTLQSQLDAGKAPTGRFADALKELGISVQDFVSMNPDQRLRAVMDAFASAPESLNRTQEAFDLLGKSGTNMLGVLDQGSGALDRGIAKTNEYGASVANAWPEIEKFHTAEANLSTTLEGVGVQVGGKVLPMFTSIVQGGADAIGVIERLPAPLQAAGVAAGAAALGFGVLIPALEAAEGAIVTFVAANPEILAFAAAAAAIGVAYEKLKGGADEVTKANEELTRSYEAARASSTQSVQQQVTSWQQAGTSQTDVATKLKGEYSDLAAHQKLVSDAMDQIILQTAHGQAITPGLITSLEKTDGGYQILRKDLTDTTGQMAAVHAEENALTAEETAHAKAVGDVSQSYQSWGPQISAVVPLMGELRDAMVRTGDIAAAESEFPALIGSVHDLAAAYRDAAEAEKDLFSKPTAEMDQGKAQLALYNAELNNWKGILASAAPGSAAAAEAQQRINSLTQTAIPQQQQYNSQVQANVDAYRSLVTALDAGALSQGQFDSKVNDLIASAGPAATQIEALQQAHQRLTTDQQAGAQAVAAFATHTADLGEKLAGIRGNAQDASTSIAGVGTAAQTAGADAQQGGDTASHAFDAVPSAVQTALAPVPGIVQGVFASAGSGAAGEGESIGEAFGAGIASGISAVTGAVAAAAAAVVTTAVTAAKAAAAIASPSRRTEDEIGLPISQGIAQGILAGVTNVNAAMGVVVGSAIEAGQQASSGMDLAQVRRGLTAGAMAEVFPSGAGNLPAPNLDALVQPWHAAQGDITAILGQLGQAEAALTAAQGQQQALQAQSAQLAAQQSYKAWQDAITQYGAGSQQAEQAGISYQQSIASANVAAAQSSEQAWKKAFDGWMAQANEQVSFAKDNLSFLQGDQQAGQTLRDIAGVPATQNRGGGVTQDTITGDDNSLAASQASATQAVADWQVAYDKLKSMRADYDTAVKTGETADQLAVRTNAANAQQVTVDSLANIRDQRVAASQAARQQLSSDLQAINQEDQQSASIRGATNRTLYTNLTADSAKAYANITQAELNAVGVTDPVWLKSNQEYITGQENRAAANNRATAVIIANGQLAQQQDQQRQGLSNSVDDAIYNHKRNTDNQIASLNLDLQYTTNAQDRQYIQQKIDLLSQGESAYESTMHQQVAADQSALDAIYADEARTNESIRMLQGMMATATSDTERAMLQSGIDADNARLASDTDTANKRIANEQRVAQAADDAVNQEIAALDKKHQAESAGAGGGGGGGGQIGPNGRIVGNVIVGGPNAGSTDPGGGYHVEGTAINPGVIQGQMDAQNMLASIDNFHGAVTGLAGTLETGLEKLGFTQSDALEHAIEVAIAGGAKLGFSNPTDTANAAFEAWSSISQIGPQNPASIARLINQLHGAGFDASTAHQWDQPANLAATQAEQYTLSAYQRTGNVGSYDTLLAQIAARSGGSNTVANTSPSNLANSIADAWWARSQGRGSQQITIHLDGATIYRGTANAQYGDIQMRQGAAA